MSIYENPFLTDADRAEIWEMLVARDIEAFVQADWSMVEDDFVVNGFFGVDAQKEPNPDNWKMKFHSLPPYRKEWLAQAAETQANAERDVARAGIYGATTLEDIEIEGDTAIAHKKFNGSVTLKTGETDTLYWQTLYICRSTQDGWKVASFVGYLPYELGA